MPFPTRLPLKPLCMLSLLALAGCAADYHHRNGLNAMEHGEYAQGVQDLQKAAELDPRDVTFRSDWLNQRETATKRLLARAETAWAAGRTDEAEQQYRTILQYEHDNARALAGLERIARSRQAQEDATKAREALTQGDTTTAAKLASLALDSQPDLADAKAVKRELEARQAKDMLATPTLGSLYKKPINLEFRDASVKMVFEALSRTTGINFIFDREVKTDQRTTVFLRQTTLEDAIDVILTTNQLDKKILNASSVLIYPNNANKSKEYQDLVVKAFYLSSSEAKQTASLLKTVLKLKDVFVDDKLNMLILREPPETIALAEKLIALHDLDEPEVMLEVEVLEVNRSRLLDLGVKVTDQLTITPITNTFSGDGTSTIRLSDLKHLNSDKLGVTLPSATISFRKEDGDANLLANPRIRVRDREKAKILIGDRVPVVTTTTTPNGFLSENIQYLEVGLKLDVEPDVHIRDEIGLKVGLEVSSVVNTVKTNNGSQAYQIGTRNTNTVLRLKDGETQVMAGLISDEDRSAANRIPLLGDLPVLGRLFSSQKDDKKKTEIVLSITPHLIRNIQRKEPTAESFWSGTEASLRTKPLQLRSIEATTTGKPAAPASGPDAKPAPTNQTVPATQPASNAASGTKVSWQGPDKAKVGESITLELRLDSPDALRAAPVQFAYKPTEFEVVSVKEGDYFSKAGKANFSQLVDKPSGRVSIGLASGEAAGARGEGRLFSVGLRPLQPNPEAEISLIAMTPVGGQQAVARPNLPLTHKINVVQ